MTIQELEATLPSGFHDAMLHSYSVDLVAKSAHFALELSIGDPNSHEEAERERYRHANLTLQGLECFFVDPPDPRYPRIAPERIDLCDADEKVTQQIPSSSGLFSARFYSAATNSFIHFSARNASISYP